jgi:chaperone required for assembly of F1-ATPase
MHFTRLANTAIDRVENDRDRAIREIMAYAGSDLLCYRAEAPRGLVARQAAGWDPVVAWAHAALGARLILIAGVVHRAQPGAALDAIRRYLDGRDAFALTALHNLTTLTGSVLLACAVAEGRLSPEDAWALAHVDEDWQIEQWGRDAEAEARRAARWAEFRAAAEFLRLSRSA